MVSEPSYKTEASGITKQYKCEILMNNSNVHVEVSEIEIMYIIIVINMLMFVIPLLKL